MARSTAQLVLGLSLVVAAHAGCGDDDSAGVSTPTGQGGNVATGGQGGSVGGSGGEQACDPRFDAFAQAVQADLAKSPALGVSVAVMEDGVVTCAAAFGSKDVHKTQPLTPSTLMRVASITKSMTAVALLRKVEAGLVSLDDTLEQALPELEFLHEPIWDDQITVRHLLTHQGALMDYLPWGGESADDDLATHGYGTYAKAWFLMNPPGIFFNYSNPNFSYAGLLTEELDTRAWPDLMVEDVLSPLGMNRTYLRRDEVEADGDYSLSFGYTANWGGADPRPVAIEDEGDGAFARPPAGAWTTPTQLMSWAKFLMDGDPAVLGDDLRKAVTEEQVDTLYGNGTVYYGYGMIVERGFTARDGSYYQLPVWQHDGASPSFSSMLTMLPEQGFAVAFISSGLFNDFYESIRVAVETLVTLPASSAPPEATIDPTTFDRHVGIYTAAWGAFAPDLDVGDFIITLHDDTLHMETPLLDQAGYDVTSKLTPLSNDLFMAVIDGGVYDLTFVPSEPGGTSTYIRNRGFVTTRVAAGVKAMPHPEVSAESIARALERGRRPPTQRFFSAPR